jgi:hypothetical protein
MLARRQSDTLQDLFVPPEVETDASFAVCFLKAVASSKRRQIGEMSVREVRRELSALDAVIEELASIRLRIQRDIG